MNRDEIGMHLNFISHILKPESKSDPKLTGAINATQKGLSFDFDEYEKHVKSKLSTVDELEKWDIKSHLDRLSEHFNS